MNARPRTFPSTVLAGAGLALALMASPAQALIVPSTHFIQADTSASTPASRLVQADPDVLFNDSVNSTGLSGQGLVSFASAAQTFARHDRNNGFAGSAEVGLGLSGGVSGSARSSFQQSMVLVDGSSFSFGGLLDADGNALVEATLKVQGFSADGGSLVDLFDLALDEGLNESIAGVLDAGAYVFSFALRAASIDPGESAFGRLDFDLQVNQPAVGNGGSVPEPQSLALVLAALLPALALRKPQRHS